MIKCPRCGREISDGTKFCYDCGYDLRLNYNITNKKNEDRFKTFNENNKCPKCGFKNKKGISFCVKCGTSLKEKENTTNTSPEPNLKSQKVSSEVQDNLPKKLCPNCGKDMLQNNICFECGFQEDEPKVNYFLKNNKCPKCHMNLNENRTCTNCGSSYCLFCGTQLSDEGTCPNMCIECPRCGNFNTNSKHCVRCGIEFDKISDNKIKCSECGFENDIKNDFCGECGNQLYTVTLNNVIKTVNPKETNSYDNLNPKKPNNFMDNNQERNYSNAPINYSQENKQKNTNNSYQVPVQEHSPSNQYNTYQPMRQLGHKSPFLTVLIGLLINGGGYFYLGKFGKGLITFIACYLFVLIGILTLGLGLIIWLIILIISLIDSYNLCKRYNNGEII